MSNKKKNDLDMGVDGSLYSSEVFVTYSSERIMENIRTSMLNVEYIGTYGSMESWPLEVLERFFLTYEGYFKIQDSKLARNLYKNRLGGDPPEGYLYVKKE